MAVGVLETTAGVGDTARNPGVEVNRPDMTAGVLEPADELEVASEMTGSDVFSVSLWTPWQATSRISMAKGVITVLKIMFCF